MLLLIIVSCKLPVALAKQLQIYKKLVRHKQSDRIFYCFFNTGAPFSQEIGTFKQRLVTIISRGNLSFFHTFPRLITHFPSLFCAKRCFYPISCKIATHYLVRIVFFSIFAVEIILFSCKFRKTIILFSCKFHQTIILFSCKQCIYQT